MASHLQGLTHQWNLEICHLAGPRFATLTSKWGISDILSLHCYNNCTKGISHSPATVSQLTGYWAAHFLEIHFSLTPRCHHPLRHFCCLHYSWIFWTMFQISDSHSAGKPCKPDLHSFNTAVHAGKLKDSNVSISGSWTPTSLVFAWPPLNSSWHVHHSKDWKLDNQQPTFLKSPARVPPGIYPMSATPCLKLLKTISPQLWPFHTVFWTLISQAKPTSPPMHSPQSFQSQLQMANCTPFTFHLQTLFTSRTQLQCAWHPQLTWSLITRITTWFINPNPTQHAPPTLMHSLDDDMSILKVGNSKSASSSQQNLHPIFTSNQL